MGLLGQIIFGSMLLGFCALIHVATLGLAISILVKIAAKLNGRSEFAKMAILTLTGFGIIVAAHTIQVWFWAGFLIWLQAFSDLETALYFSLVTYTTLGYGDIVPDQSIRLFASFAAVTGLLTFGLSTAFLVGLFGRILPKMGDKKNGERSS